MSAVLQIDSTRLDHLDWLESEAIHILREVEIGRASCRERVYSSV